MNILTILILAVLAIAMLPLAIAVGRIAGRHLAANSLTHPDGQISLKAEEVIATRFLIGRPGTAATQVLLCDEDETPAYLIEDTADSADVTAGAPVACAVLGATEGTKRGISAEAIAANVDVYVADGGKLQNEPAVAGTYHKVGRSKTATTDEDQEIVFTPCVPVKLVVVAALTSTNGTAAAASADLAALAAEAEKIGDDVRAIGAALATATLVKVLSA